MDSVAREALAQPHLGKPEGIVLEEVCARIVDIAPQAVDSACEPTLGDLVRRPVLAPYVERGIAQDVGDDAG